jgi:XapX domain-containing protein
MWQPKSVNVGQNMETTERKNTRVSILIIAFFAGVVIAVIFRSLKVTVPVPHDLAGLVGLIGMFVGSAAVDIVAKMINK